MRYTLDRSNVGGDVLALGAVTARRCTDELSALVADRDGQAVDLRLGHDDDRFALVEIEEAPHARDEFADVSILERVAERQHRRVMAELAEGVGGRRADAF